MNKLMFVMAVVSTTLMAMLMQATPMSGAALPTCPPYPGMELCDPGVTYPGVEIITPAATIDPNFIPGGLEETPEIIEDFLVAENYDPIPTMTKMEIEKPEWPR